MNDTMSLLLATGILAVGGLGLFMYKNNSDDNDSNIQSDDNDKNNFFDFDLRSFFGNSDKDGEDKNEYDDKSETDTDSEPEVYEPPKRTRGSKTKNNRKNMGTKRRY